MRGDDFSQLTELHTGSVAARPWPRHDSDTAALVRALDWSKTDLGPIQAWPPHLTAAVDILLRAPTPMALLWGRGGIMIYNDAYAGVAGARHPALLGSKVLEGWPEVADFMRMIMAEGFGGQSVLMADQLLVLDRGSGPESLYFDLSFSPVVGPGGAVEGVLAVVGQPARVARGDRPEDAAQHTKLNKALNERAATPIDVQRSSETEAHLSRLIESVVDYAIYMLDIEGRVSTWNPGAQRIKGYSRDEIVGKHFSQFYTEEDRANGEPARALQLAATQGKYEKEAWRLRKDGSRFWASVVIDPIRGERGELLGYAKVTRDITDKRNAELALEEAREALFQSQKMDAVGKLTAGIAHDFNNMLAGIVGAMQLIERRVSAGRYDDIGKYLEAALASANRAAALTARLLAFGRRQSLDLRPTDVNASVRSMEDLLRRTIGENIAIEIRPDPDLPPALTDVNQLENALLNLAINARDAMPTGGVLTIETRAIKIDEGQARELIEASPGAYVRLRVKDTGHGMTPEVRARAFDPFFTTKPLGQGAGLGLSMIYGFARQVGGFVQIESAPNAGATVDICMPLAQAEPAQESAEGKPAPRGRGETVLVVEDDPTVRLLVIDLLHDLGYEAVAGADAAEALPVLQSERRIDLLLTDVGLPGGINGRQLAEMAREKRPTLRVLMMTGYAEAAAARGGFLAPGMDLISKPFQIDVLGSKIREIMEPGR